MSLKNIKSNTQNQKGFTIVELLIVVVVIAILAAITIVSYNGITNRANQSASKSTAASVQKKIELYNSEVGNYPISYTALSSDATKSYTLPASSYGSAAPTASTTGTTGKSYVQVQACATSGIITSTLTASNISGIKITYWSYGGDGTTVGAATFATLGSDSACANAINLGA